MTDIWDKLGKDQDTRNADSLRHYTCSDHFEEVHHSPNIGYEFCDVLVVSESPDLLVDGCTHHRSSSLVAHTVEDDHHTSTAGIRSGSLLGLRSQNEHVFPT